MTVFAFNKGVVFVANTRAASSTMHHLLLPLADVIFYRPIFGKHFTLSQIARRTKMMSGLDLGALLTFGIVREPQSWLYSWFKFRRREGLTKASTDGNPNRVPAGVSFPEFLEECCGANPRPFARIQHQSSYFRDSTGRIAVDYVAVYSDLRAECRRLSAIPSLSLLDGAENLSVNATAAQRAPTCDTARPDLVDRIASVFADDFELYERAASAELRNIRAMPRPMNGCVELDSRERREDTLSRIMLHFALGEREAVARLIPRLDSEGRNDEHIRWICNQMT